jgi:tetratricopeptide (TPR) repeat protein
MLNRALKLMDLDVIIKMGFFVCDLHRHIEKLHSEQFDGHHSNKTFTVYRGQGVSKADFEKMKKTKGGLTSFNTFLSTSKDRSISLSFARQAVNNPDLVGILFVMTIDPSKSTVPFASTAGVSYYEGADDEVLFSMHTVFRICDIKPMNENDRLFQIDLILTSDNDKDLHILTDRMREEIFQESNGWHRLSLLLLKMGQLEKAQQVYEVILGQTSDEGEKGNIYHQIGLVKYDQGEYKEACTFYEKALEIRRKTLPPNHPNLASSYNNIGLVCSAMGEHSKALSYYEKTLEIRQKILPPNHPDLASSYNNVGSVYSKMGQYSKALSYYEKVLEIQQKTLPPNHPDLGTSYNNIGMVYGEMAEYSKAISSYQHAVDIAQRSLPANHPYLEKFRKNFEDAKKKL